jgi:predicted nuclease of predicted toxin-antitoxin system
MPIPSLYFDECVDHGLLIRLRQRGYTVTTAQVKGMVGVSDAEQLAYATRYGWMIVSTDTGDFQRLHSLSRRDAVPHSGILLLPTGQLDRMEVRAAMMVDWIAALPEYRSMLFRWNDVQQRLIHGERIPGYSEDDVRRALGHPA